MRENFVTRTNGHWCQAAVQMSSPFVIEEVTLASFSKKNVNKPKMTNKREVNSEKEDTEQESILYHLL
jgi:hypothetical protein